MAAPAQTPRYDHNPISMKLLTEEQFHTYREHQYYPGQFCWTWGKGGERRICIRVPAPHPKYYALTHVRVKLHGCDEGMTQPYWEWNGDEVRPTLTPSLDVQGCWHGFVVNGQLVEA